MKAPPPLEPISLFEIRGSDPPPRALVSGRRGWGPLRRIRKRVAVACLPGLSRPKKRFWRTGLELKNRICGRVVGGWTAVACLDPPVGSWASLPVKRGGGSATRMGHGGGRQKKGTKAKITASKKGGRPKRHVGGIQGRTAHNEVVFFGALACSSPFLICVCEGGILLLWLWG